MAVAKRCPFCHKKLDAKGLCQNKECVDYERTKIIEGEEDKTPDTDTGK
jgi:hypothetical protein